MLQIQEMNFSQRISAQIQKTSAQNNKLLCADLFDSSVTRIAFRKNGFLRVFHYDFVEMFAPKLTRDVVEKTFDLN